MFNFIKFIKNAIRELEHVVWPTPKETRKYMNYNVWTIIVVTLILSVLGFALSTTLTELRKVTYSGPTAPIANPNNQPATKNDLDNLLKNLSGSIKASGEAVSVQTTPITSDQSGATLPVIENTSNSGVAQ